MTKNCNDILESYRRLLSDGLSIKRTKFGCEILTPFLKSNNDAFTVYVEDVGNGRFRVTDLGETITEFELSGLSLASPKQKSLLQRIQKTTSTSIEDYCIEKECDFEGLPYAIQSVLRAMDDVAHMEYLAREATIVEFPKLVYSYLKNRNLSLEYEEGGVDFEIVKDVPFKFDMRLRRNPALAPVLVQAYHIDDKSRAVNTSTSKSLGYFMMKANNIEFVGISILDNPEMWSTRARTIISSASSSVFDWDDKEGIETELKQLAMP